MLVSQSFLVRLTYFNSYWEDFYEMWYWYSCSKKESIVHQQSKIINAKCLQIEWRSMRQHQLYFVIRAILQMWACWNNMVSIENIVHAKNQHAINHYVEKVSKLTLAFSLKQH